MNLFWPQEAPRCSRINISRCSDRLMPMWIARATKRSTVPPPSPFVCLSLTIYFKGVRFHPNGNLLLVGGEDKTLRFFRIDGEKNETQLSLPSSILPPLDSVLLQLFDSTIWPFELPNLLAIPLLVRWWLRGGDLTFIATTQPPERQRRFLVHLPRSHPLPSSAHRPFPEKYPFP